MPGEPSLFPWILAGIGFGATLVCAAGWYLASSDLSRLPDTLAPAPEVVPREPLRPSARTAPTEVTGGPEVAPLPRQIVVVYEKPNPWRVDRNGDFSVFRIDRPNDTYKLDLLGAGNKLKLVGRASKLSVEGVTGGAVLDTTELVTKAVSFTGLIDGGATVKLKVGGGGSVLIRGVDGATVTIDAPGGTVTFEKAKGEAAAIDGARVTVTAKTVAFTAPVTGPETRVDVTMTARGNLRFAELSDAARMVYRRAKADDPPPVVTPGTIRDTAECKRDE